MNERISLELFKLIYNYVKSKKEIDDVFIDKVVEIVVINLDLNDYVKDIKINNSPWDGTYKITGAEYNSYLKKISINLQGLIAFHLYELKYFKFSDLEKVLYIYISIVQILLHELEHAKQYKKMDVNTQDLETKILKICYRHSKVLDNEKLLEKLAREGIPLEVVNIYCLELYKRYQRNHEYATHERLADCYSYQTIYEIINQLKLCPNLVAFVGWSMYATLLLGYDKGIIPTKYYLEQIVSSDEWPEIAVKSQSLNYERCLFLGLEIPNDKLNELLAGKKELGQEVLKLRQKFSLKNNF